MTRAYRVVAKLKNNRLWTAILAQWPDVTTQADAARRLGMEQGLLGDWLNIQRCPVRPDRPLRPMHERLYREGFTLEAWRVATALLETPEYLFDRDLYGLPPAPMVIELDRPALEAHGLIALPPSPGDGVDEAEQQQAVGRALEMLTPREQAVLRRRMDDATYEEIGMEQQVTGERIRQIEAKALRKLRHPTRSKHLRPFVESR